jgi:hypothetical protein
MASRRKTLKVAVWLKNQQNQITKKISPLTLTNKEGHQTASVSLYLVSESTRHMKLSLFDESGKGVCPQYFRKYAIYAYKQ